MTEASRPPAGDAGRDPQFRLLWTGAATSQLGSAVGGVALPLIALGPLHAPSSAVALVALVQASALLVTALPAGAFVETRRKRPVLVAADAVRAAALAGVPLLAWAGLLGVPYLCVVAAANGAAGIVFSSASQAHLRDLVDDHLFTDANARLLSTTWLALVVGPSLAGALLVVVSPVWLCAIDAASFVVSALAVTRLTRPEHVHALEPAGRLALVTGGVRLVAGDTRLRRLLLAWAAFAGLASAWTPAAQVFYLRELHFSASQYGLLMGLPSLGGFLGARATRRIAAGGGVERALRLASWARGGVYLLVPLLVGGTVGLVLAMACFGLTLFTTSLANSAMGTVRARATPGAFQARVAALWGFAAQAAGPLLVAASAPLLARFGAREVLAVLAVAIALTPLLLPRASAPDAH